MSRSERGFTLIETLVAVAVLAIATTLGLALVRERLDTARVRIAAQQFVVHLRAARFAAVSTRNPVEVVVSTDPANSYAYTDVRGATKTIDLPSNVRITSSSTPITFQANGSVPGGASTVIEVDLSGERIERWTITTEPLGVPRLTTERIGF